MTQTYNDADKKHLQKIKLGSEFYYLKDAAARAILDTYGTAATKDYSTEISVEATESDSSLPTASAIKTYVAGEIAKAPHFTYKVVDTLPEPPTSEDLYIIYLVPDTSAEAGAYVEYLAIEKSDKSLAWEQIGSTKTDLSDYLTKTATVAGVAFGDDKAITVAELEAESALNLKALAHAATASGSTTLETIDSIAMKELTVAGDATITSTATDATLTKGDYTPAGSITGEAIKGGSIEVTVKDADTATEATLGTETFTPAGTVTAKAETGSFTALKSAEMIESDSDAGIQIEGEVSMPSIEVDDSTVDTFVKSLKAGDVDAATFTEGGFTPAEIQDGFYTAGSDAELSEGAQASLTDQTKSSFATAGILAHVGKTAGHEDEDAVDDETLVLEAAPAAEAVTDRGTFTANTLQTLTGGKATVVDTSKFFGGDKAADTFSANKLPVVDGTADAVTSVTAELSEAPVFTGKKYLINTTSDTALKEVEFTATNSAAIVNEVKYFKQEIDTKTFTPEAATLGFEGTKAEEIIVTGVSYDKADATAAYSTKVTPEVDALTKTAKTIAITVNPD